MTDIFKKLRAFRNEPDEAVYDCREDCFMQLFRNVTVDDCNQWISSLEADGFEVLQRRELYGNFFAQLKRDILVTAYLTPCNGELRVTATERKATPAFEPLESICENGTAIYFFENDHSLIDCGMCLMIQCPDYSFFIVDSGHYLQFNDNDRIYKFMRERTPEGQKVVVNGWLLTHAHTDHVSKFIDFLEYNCYDTVIEGIYSNLLPCDYPNHTWSNEEVELSEKLFSLMERLDIPQYKLHSGQRFYVRNLSFDVLGTHEDIYPDFIEDYNDSSCVVMLEVDGSKVLIPGDASVLASKRLEERYGKSLKCDVVQVSHHGHRGLSTHAYELIAPSVAVFPITRIKFDEEYPRIEANRRLVEISERYYITSDGTVKIPLPFKLETVEALPDESFEDFEKIKRLWRYEYTEERKAELYRLFVEHGGDLGKFVFPTSPTGNFEM